LDLPLKGKGIAADMKPSELRLAFISVRNNDRFAHFTSAAFEAGFAMILCSSQIRRR
jgi:hypothetical protein